MGIKGRQIVYAALEPYVLSAPPPKISVLLIDWHGKIMPYIAGVIGKNDHVVVGQYRRAIEALPERLFNEGVVRPGTELVVISSEHAPINKMMEQTSRQARNDAVQMPREIIGNAATFSEVREKLRGVASDPTKDRVVLDRAQNSAFCYATRGVYSEMLIHKLEKEGLRIPDVIRPWGARNLPVEVAAPPAKEPVLFNAAELTNPTLFAEAWARKAAQIEADSPIIDPAAVNNPFFCAVAGTESNPIDMDIWMWMEEVSRTRDRCPVAIPVELDDSDLEGEVSAVRSALRHAQRMHADGEKGPKSFVVYGLDSDIAALFLANYDIIANLPDDYDFFWYDSYHTRRYYIDIGKWVRSFVTNSPDEMAAVQSYFFALMCTGTDYTPRLITESRFDAMKDYFRMGWGEFEKMLESSLFGNRDTKLRDGSVMGRQLRWIWDYYRARNRSKVPDPLTSGWEIDEKGMCVPEGTSEKKRSREEGESEGGRAKLGCPDGAIFVTL